MKRDFEFKQLLRAYRAGIINEQTFETEMAALEYRNGANGSNGTAGGFRAFGKNYASEREAVLTFLDMAQAAEANGAPDPDGTKNDGINTALTITPTDVYGNPTATGWSDSLKPETYRLKPWRCWGRVRCTDNKTLSTPWGRS